MEKSLKKSIIYLYGLPSYGFQVFVNLEIYYFAAFLTDFAKIPTALTGLILTITSIIDILWVPTAGIMIEKSNMKWGKYRSWMLIGPPIAVLFFVLQFSKIGSPAMNAFIIIIGFAISHLVWNAFYASHVAMTSSMTTIREERISLAANRGMFNSLGSITFSLIGMKMIMSLGKNNPASGYTLTAVITGIFMILCYYLFFFVSKDYDNPDSVQAANTKEKMSISEMLKQIIVNPPLIGLLLSEFGRYLGRFVIFGLAFYYFKYVLAKLGGLTVFFTGLNVVCFFGAIISNTLAKKFGERNTYIFSLSLLIIGLLLVFVLPINYISFLIIMFLAYLGYGMPDALGPAMYAATVEYGEWKTGKNVRGFIMSLINFPIKTAIFVRSVIITTVLTLSGYVADMAPTTELIKNIKSGFTLVPAIIIALGLLIFTFLNKITTDKLQQMQKEIAQRI